MNILIVTNFVRREFGGSVLLKMELERRGHFVEICNVTIGHRWITNRFFKYDVLLISSAYDTNYVLCKVSKVHPQPIIINMQWEQYWGDENDFPPREIATEIAHMCWGEYRKRKSIAAGVPEENLIVTGALHHDVCRPELRNLLKTKNQLAEAYDLPCDKKWVLFVGAFTYLRSDNLDSWYASASANTKEKIKRDYTYQNALFPIFIEWLERLLKQTPDTLCIYRPHPSEPMAKEFLELQSKYKNFRVIGELDLRHWLNAADHVNYCNSSSIVDAYFMEKSCSITNPYGIPEFGESEFLRLKKTVRTYDEFEESILGECNEFPCETSKIQDAYFSGKYPAYINVCNAIEDIAVNRKEEYYNCLTDRLDFESSWYRPFNIASFVTEMMGMNCIYLCEAFANVFNLAHMLFSHFNTITLADFEMMADIKQEQMRVCEILGYEYGSPKDIVSTNKINFDVECFDKAAYTDFVSRLEYISGSDNDDYRNANNLMELLCDLFSTYEAEIPIDRNDLIVYMMPYTKEIAKVVLAGLKREKYVAPEHLRGTPQEYAKEKLKGNQEMILYGMGGAGSRCLDLFVANDFKIIEAWDRAADDIDSIRGTSVVKPFCREPDNELTIAITMGHQKHYYEVEKELKKRGYKVINGVFTAACLSWINGQN